MVVGVGVAVSVAVLVIDRPRGALKAARQPAVMGQPKYLDHGAGLQRTASTKNWLKVPKSWFMGRLDRGVGGGE